MRIVDALRRRTLDLLVAILSRWLKPTVLDAAAVAACGRTHCYVLPQRSLLDLIACELACKASGLAPPRAPLRSERIDARNAFFSLAHSEGLLLRRRSLRHRSAMIRATLDAARAGESIAVVPVSIFWGRAPNREHSVFRLLLSERWTATSGLRRFLGLLFNRKHLFVRFGAPIALEEVIDEPPAPEIEERRLARLLRTRFRRAREALIGPDLSHRRTLLDRVLASRSVSHAVQAHAARTGEPVQKSARRARRNAEEIAADLSYPVIRFFDVLLSWLWNRLYDGIQVRGIDAVKAAAETHTIIYVPSHRSHVDYLLMSYVLFYNGLMLPHVAAGKNLNIPVVGPLLRRAGAFFMRRSFRDDPLYAAVFEEYLDRVYAGGFSVEYFIEGGRSRTGRLLPARGGMLSMTLRSFLRDPDRSLAFVPVYFGYEKVIEARSYMGELSGQTKRSESLSGLVRSVRFLRQSFGKVQVNFGTPIVLGDYLDAHAPQWRDGPEATADATAPTDDAAAADTATDDRPNQRALALAGKSSWFTPTVRQLGEALSQGINSAAAVNPVAALATVLLATPRQALDEHALEAQLDCLLRIAREAPVSASVSVTPLSGRETIRYCEAAAVVQREIHPLGDILALGPVERIQLTWYRNNIAHLFALPSLIAVLVASGRRWSLQRLQGNVRSVYPFLRSELYLPWETAEIDALVARQVALLEDMSLLVATKEGFEAPPPEAPGHARLQQLAALVMPTLERYYIAIALIDSHPQGALTRDELVSACVLTAQRTARLFGLDAPEFFDATLFRRYLSVLLEQGVVSLDDHDRLVHDESLHPVLIGATRVLDPAFCQGVTVIRLSPAMDALSAA
ncbi:MAG TPA: 1-acyl-sn-glycerol-3-phosphate acyltransferase [Pseudomonadales bacterium]|nr:1-acyl-sn-glycerol-3-phosphate acyltransferase [Pseudomonadales bacterium]